MLGLAAELRAKFGFLRRDAGRAGVQMALPRHVTADRDEHCSAEGILIGPEKRCDENVACRRQTAVGAKPDAAAHPVLA